jgi:hypothetical protein
VPSFSGKDPVARRSWSHPYHAGDVRGICFARGPDVADLEEMKASGSPGWAIWVPAWWTSRLLKRALPPRWTRASHRWRLSAGPDEGRTPQELTTEPLTA